MTDFEEMHEMTGSGKSGLFEAIARKFTGNTSLTYPTTDEQLQSQLEGFVPGLRELERLKLR